MNSALSISRLLLRERLRRVAGWVMQQIGWGGIVGLVLIAGAGSIAWTARPHDRPMLSQSAPPIDRERGLPTVNGQATEAVRPVESIPLPRTSDIPVLLSRIERAAVREGLGWPRAEYRLDPANADTPATLVLTVALQGGYLNVRRFVGAILRDTPSLTLRTLEISRTSSDSADVRGQMTIAVYLKQGDAADRGPTR